jgi:hypothetical protein
MPSLIIVLLIGEHQNTEDERYRWLTVSGNSLAIIASFVCWAAEATLRCI